jgi:hypothetical protein
VDEVEDSGAPQRPYVSPLATTSVLILTFQGVQYLRQVLQNLPALMAPQTAP